LSDLSIVDGAWSNLVRTGAGLSMSLHTSEITPGDAVTIWWVVFNRPSECTAGIPGMSTCGEPDLFNPDVEASVLHAAGHVIGGSGKASFAGHLAEGDTSAAVFGPGLLDSKEAEVHFIVHTHGPKIPGIVSSQVHSFLGGCRIDEWVGLLGALGITEEELPLRGVPGPNVCMDTQASIHVP